MFNCVFDGRKTILLPLGAAAALLMGVQVMGAQAALAGGGFSEPVASGSGSATIAGTGDLTANSTGTTIVSAPGVSYSSAITAEAQTSVSAGGLHAGVATGAEGAVEASGDAVIQRDSVSKTTSFTKNGGVIAKGRTEARTTVTIGGKTYLVTDEVARAVARATPFGGSSASSAEQNVYTDSNGYSANTVNTDKTVRGAH